MTRRRTIDNEVAGYINGMIIPRKLPNLIGGVMPPPYS